MTAIRFSVVVWEHPEMCVSALALSVGWVGGRVGRGGDWLGGWGECVTSCPGVV